MLLLLLRGTSGGGPPPPTLVKDNRPVTGDPSGKVRTITGNPGR